ncbi:MAG: di-heme oxidoredictase family protein [Draconibacterium sp.]
MKKNLCSFILKKIEKKNYHIFFSLLIIVLGACNGNDDDPEITKLDGELTGGSTTVFINSSQAFSMPAPNLAGERLDRHTNGDVAFDVNFVSHPAQIHGGLGPVFNNSSCAACHPSDGRSPFPENLNAESGFFLRMSLPGADENNGPLPVPGFGTQLQHQALFGYQKEAQIEVSYEEIKRVFDDGTVVTLQKPIYTLRNPYIPVPADVLISPRIGMPVFGLGLLEAISEQDILANADEADKNDDDISGKPNYVWDPVSASTKLGRFGWKASTPGVLVQSAGAYHQDMGVTSYIFPHESSAGQSSTDTTFNFNEVSDQDLDDVAFYVQTLAVPAARNFDNEQVIRGKKIFEQINCNACHIESFTTGILEGVPEVSNQRIFPYTDMLLHDMGEDLTDNRSDFLASGKEWKTRPLWGIGLTSVVNGHTQFLHDGRAKSVTEAILWHGGEAEKSRDDFMKLSKEEREDLIKFINSL